MKIKKPVILIASIGASQMAGLIGSVFTANAIPTWYAQLSKPFFSPPNWVFGPVWITLYSFMGISIYLIVISKSKKKRGLVNLFFVHLALNAAWSIIFFGFKNPFLAFIEIAFLWGVIAIMTTRFHEVNKKAAYLLVPYLVWVSFAAVLNYNIWMLN